MATGYFAGTRIGTHGRRREDGEDILETARRELYEETGAIAFDITPICIYSVTAPDNFDGMETFGTLFFADIFTFEEELHSEIEEIAFMNELPINWTYPEIQPKLLEQARKRGFFIPISWDKQHTSK